MEESERDSSKATQQRPALTRGAVLAVILAFGAAYMGNYHFAYGGGGIKKIPKVGWALSETFVNLNEVAGTPPILLKAKYPLFVQAIENWRE